MMSMSAKPSPLPSPPSPSTTKVGSGVIQTMIKPEPGAILGGREKISR
jgi:hypothetical protein